MPSSRRLSDRNLPLLADRVAIPTYDRHALRRGVVHISVGSFHRSHQAVYFDELARRGLGDGWALTGVGLHRREMKEVLEAQDGLYTVVERGDDAEARIVGVITRYLFAPEENEAVLDALADESTRLVTLTVTTGGYKVDIETGAFDAGDPAVVHDLENPTAPRTAMGLLVEALDRRRVAGHGPFTVLSCDNFPANGAIARASVLAFAALRDPLLTAWIEEYVTFPSSMVDRITPNTSAEHRAMVERTFGVRDRWPVVTEEFSQWIVEDSFCNGRPPLDEVGAQFVEDVRPYALMKTRLLNGAHSALGYLGTLAGHEHADEAMADPAFATYVERFMDHEVAPLLPPVEIDLAAYTATLRARLASRAIADPLARLCRNGSAKVPAHLLSSIREARALGRPHALLTLAVSAWCRHLSGIADDGAVLGLDDPQGERLRSLSGSPVDPAPLLADDATFGSLGRDPVFVEAVRRDLRDIAARGTRNVIASRVEQHARLETR